MHETGASAHGDLLNGGKDLLTDYDAVFKLNVRAPIQLIHEGIHESIHKSIH